MSKMKIEIKDHLGVQGYGQKDGKVYVRVAVPIETSDEYDIQPKDLIKIIIVDHIKVGRD